METRYSYYEIKAFLSTYYDDDELESLFFDVFGEGTDILGKDFPREKLAQEIVKFCRHREKLPNLLDAMKRTREEQYLRSFPTFLNPLESPAIDRAYPQKRKPPHARKGINKPQVQKQRITKKSTLYLWIGSGAIVFLVLVILGIYFVPKPVVPTPTPIIASAESQPHTTKSPVITKTSFEVGQSVEGRLVNATCFGNGNHVLVIIGGIHGDEDNPVGFLSNMQSNVQNDPSGIPSDGRVCFIPDMNPDGFATHSHFNANGVALNQNWDTNDWQAKVMSGGTGGPNRFSEPEVNNLASFLKQLSNQGASLVVVFYHSTITPNSNVRPTYKLSGSTIYWDSMSDMIASVFANKVGYLYNVKDPIPITGESLHWLADNDMMGFGVEMPDDGVYNSSTLQKHWNAFVSILNNWP